MTNNLDASPPNYSAQHLEELARAARTGVQTRAESKYPHLYHLVDMAEHFAWSIHEAAQAMTDPAQVQGIDVYSRRMVSLHITQARDTAAVLAANLGNLSQHFDEPDALTQSTITAVIIDAEKVLLAAREALGARRRMVTCHQARRHLDASQVSK
jgi:hypothetical protein